MVKRLMHLIMISSLGKIYFFVLALSVVLITSNDCRQEKIDNDLPIKIADSFIDLHPDTVAYKNEPKSYKWNYEQGLILEAIFQLWKDTREDKYFNYIKKNIDYYVKRRWFY